MNYNNQLLMTLLCMKVMDADCELHSEVEDVSLWDPLFRHDEVVEIASSHVVHNQQIGLRCLEYFSQIDDVRMRPVVAP